MFPFLVAQSSQTDGHWATVVFTAVAAPALVSWGTAFFTSKSQVENRVAKLEATLEYVKASNDRILNHLLEHRENRRG